MISCKCLISMDVKLLVRFDLLPTFIFTLFWFSSGVRISHFVVRSLRVILGKRGSVLNTLDVACNPRQMKFEALDYEDEKSFPVFVTTLRCVFLNLHFSSFISVIFYLLIC
jgi:hypothetical protein